MIDDRFESVSRPKLHADLPKTSPSAFCQNSEREQGSIV